MAREVAGTARRPEVKPMVLTLVEIAVEETSARSVGVESSANSSGGEVAVEVMMAKAVLVDSSSSRSLVSIGWEVGVEKPRLDGLPESRD